MITKRIIGELVLARLNGGTPTVNSKVDEREVWAVCDTVIPSLIAAEVKANQQAGNFQLNGDWITTYPDVPVQFDQTRKEFYAVLPAKLVSLPGDRGLRMVSPMEDQSTQYIIGSNNSLSMMKNLDVGQYQRFCYVEGDKVFLVNWDSRCKSVLIKMVANTSTEGEDEPLPVPAMYGEKLLDMVYRKFVEQQNARSKQTNDSNPNTV